MNQKKKISVLSAVKDIDYTALQKYLNTLGKEERITFIAKFLEPIRLIHSDVQLQIVLENLLAAAIAMTHAERGFISLKSIDNKLVYKSGMDNQNSVLVLRDFYIEREILDKIISNQTPQLFPPQKKAFSRKTPYILATPLFIHKELVGLLYLTSSNEMLSAGHSAWEFFRLFCDQSALAIRNAQYYNIARNSREENETLKKSLMESDKLAIKGTMAAKVGHEINNFLSGINANIEMASDLVEYKGEAQDVLNRLLRARQMITNMSNLANSLMERTSSDGNFQKSSINVLVSNFFDFVQPIYKSADVQLDKELDPELPQVRIDSGLMMQVLFNLVKNAVEAKPDAKITVITEKDKKRQVRIIVKDNGPGIPPDKQRKIFEPLFTDKSTGHGYGLAICKEIIEKHNGNIAVSSERGKGTSFIMTIPVSIAEDYAELEFDQLELLEDIRRMQPRQVRKQKRVRKQSDQSLVASVN